MRARILAAAPPALGIVLGWLALDLWWEVVVDMPSFPILNRDSTSYVENWWYRTPGYPLLLDALHGATGTWHSVIVFQATLAAVATLFLCHALYVFTGSLSCVALFGVGVLFDATPQIYQLSILTESVFQSLLLIQIGLGLRALRDPRPSWLIACSSVAALCAFVRPPGLACFGSLLLLAAVLGRSEGRRAVAALMLPFVLVMVGWSSWNLHRYGSSALMLRGGVAMFGNAGHLLRAGTGGELAPLVDRLAPTAAQYRRELEQAPDARARERLKKKHFALLVGKRADPRTDEAVLGFMEENRDLVCAGRARTSELEFDEICESRLQKRLASVATRHDLPGYLRRTVSNGVEFWRDLHTVRKLHPRALVASRYEAEEVALLAEQLGFPRADLLRRVPELDRRPSKHRKWLSNLMKRPLRSGGELRVGHGLAMLDALAALVALCVAAHRVLRPAPGASSTPMFGAALFAIPLVGVAALSALTHFAMPRYAHILHACALGMTVLVVWALVRDWRGAKADPGEPFTATGSA